LLFTVAWGESYSQSTKISLNLRDVPVRRVIQEIEQKTDFYFLYQDEVLDRQQRITIEMENVLLEQVIEQLEKQASVIAEVSENQIVLKRVVAENRIVNDQQQKQISGFVSDQNGQPLPGVTVIVRGTTTGTVTNADGEFTLTILDEAEVLVFSFVGMKSREVSVVGKNMITVLLEEEAIGLQEVVAVGYGTQKKANLTGSVSSVKMGELEMIPSANTALLLQGRLPGVTVTSGGAQPGKDDPQIRIRGIGTLGNNNPMVIVD
jgi:hypothetical protein